MFVKYNLDVIEFLNLDYIEHIEVFSYRLRIEDVYADVIESEKGRLIEVGEISCFTKEPACRDDNYRAEEYKIFDPLCGPNVYEAANALFEAMSKGDKAFDITKYYSEHDYTCCDEEGE